MVVAEEDWKCSLLVTSALCWGIDFDLCFDPDCELCFQIQIRILPSWPTESFRLYVWLGFCFATILHDNSWTRIVGGGV